MRHLASGTSRSTYQYSQLRSLALIRLAILERLQDALARLIEATTAMGTSGPWAAGRCHPEPASMYKDLAISEDSAPYFIRRKIIIEKPFMNSQPWAIIGT